MVPDISKYETVTLFRSGRVLRVPPGFQSDDLRRLVSLLEGETC